jgi:hypothetical protein
MPARNHLPHSTHRPVAAALIATTLLLAGCQSTSLQDPTVTAATGQQDVDQISYLQDFPIPRGAKWDKERTLILGSGKAWTGRLVYSVSMTESEVFQFFQDQMARLQWQPVSVVRSKVSILSYVQSNRAALVELSSASFGSSTVVSITVTPR